MAAGVSDKSIEYTYSTSQSVYNKHEFNIWHDPPFWICCVPFIIMFIFVILRHFSDVDMEG